MKRFLLWNPVMPLLALALSVYLMLRAGRIGTFDIVVLVVDVAWFALALFDWATRGRVYAWAHKEDDDDVPPARVHRE